MSLEKQDACNEPASIEDILTVRIYLDSRPVHATGAVPLRVKIGSDPWPPRTAPGPRSGEEAEPGWKGAPHTVAGSPGVMPRREFVCGFRLFIR
jgi:hypothetical protein